MKKFLLVVILLFTFLNAGTAMAAGCGGGAAAAATVVVQQRAEEERANRERLRPALEALEQDRLRWERWKLLYEAAERSWSVMCINNTLDDNRKVCDNPFSDPVRRMCIDPTFSD